MNRSNLPPQEWSESSSSQKKDHPSEWQDSVNSNSSYINMVTLNKNPRQRQYDDESIVSAGPSHKSPAASIAEAAHFDLSETRKWTLLCIFSAAAFIDIWCYSAFFIFTGSIAEDLEVRFEQQSWVITSYAVTFSAFLLFWGRVSDLYSSKPVFTWGFLVLGVLNIGISFLPEQYSFFVVRALAGVAGSSREAFTLYSLATALANVTGTILAGVIMYIPGHGQMAAWRWFFRILGALVLPLALASFYLCPQDEGDQANIDEPKWRRLDLVGSFIILFAIVLLTLGLTFGASYGWKTTKFLVPFLLSVVLFPLFFIWEASLADTHALVSADTWRIPNFTAFAFLALQLFPWWGVNFLGLAETYMKVYHEKAINAAVRILPEGIIGLIVAMVLTEKAKLVSRPRNTVTIGLVLGIAGYVLMTRPAERWNGIDYWKFVFPGMVLGSGGIMACFIATNVGMMTSAPKEKSGVAGAILQVSLQIGNTVGFATQAGLLTVNPGGLANPDNLKASFYFQMGWCALWLVIFLAIYRAPKKTTNRDEEDRGISSH